jgi:proline iminopeptidase
MALLLALALVAVSWSCAAEQRGAAAAAGEGWVTLPSGARLYYRMAGSGADTIVVPGAMNSTAGLEPLTAAHTVIFYDLLGRGRSDPADTSRIVLDSMVADLEVLRGHFRLERMGLAGASVTALVSALYAATHPQRVTRLALINPLPPTAAMHLAYNPPERTTRVDTAAQAELLRLRQSGASPEAICRQFWKASSGWFVGDPASAANLDPSWCALPNESADAALLWLGYLARASGAWDLSARARGITAPTLVVQGERDYWANPAGARAWATAIPDALLLTLPGVGHMALREAPDAVTTALTEFFAGRTPAGAVATPP